MLQDDLSKRDASAAARCISACASTLQSHHLCICECGRCHTHLPILHFQVSIRTGIDIWQHADRVNRPVDAEQRGHQRCYVCLFDVAAGEMAERPWRGLLVYLRRCVDGTADPSAPGYERRARVIRICGGQRQGMGFGSGRTNRGPTSIAMVADPRHPMISREHEARVLVAVKLRYQLLRLAHEVIHDTYIVHVFLLLSNQKLSAPR